LETKNLVGESVIHKAFGIGVVEKADEKYLEVIFQQGEKKSVFAYPSCFNTFLRLENEELQASLQEDLQQWKKDSNVDHKEALKSRYMKRQQGIRARQIATEERKEQAARRSMELRTSYRREKKEASNE